MSQTTFLEPVLDERQLPAGMTADNLPRVQTAQHLVRIVTKSDGTQKLVRVEQQQ